MSPFHTLQVPDARPITAADLDGLGQGQYEGHLGRIKLGSGSTRHVEEFLWDSDTSEWVGARELVVMSTDDAWALDWTRQPLSAVRNVWCRPNGGVGWARSGAAAILREPVTLPSVGTPFDMPIEDYGSDTLPDAGNLTVRGLVFTYASPVEGGSGAKIIPDVELVTPGGVGVILPATDGGPVGSQPTPIIPYAPVQGGGGDPGGWGTTPVPLQRVGELWAAGFRLEERMHAWMNGSQDLKRLSIAPWYINVSPGDDYDYPRLSDPPPSGMLGPGVTLLGGTEHMAGITSPGSGTVIDERRFRWVESNWTAWSAAAPTKSLLIPMLYGKMPADANDTGQSYGITLSLRWVQA